ncbi:MAG: adenylate/guanylate cyclase domain-containing protein, partial [Gammaproteobacteria bacterium]
MKAVRQWLKELRLERYVEAFEAEEVDAESFFYLTEDDLKEMGLPIGPRRKILAVISKGMLDQNIGSQEITSRHSTRSATKLPIPRSTKTHTNKSPSLAPAPVREAEHRQLTVMFCDLVGSTELSTKFDPEVLREMMGAYQTAAGAVIDSYDGHVAQYLGDGLMVYFGWPQAHEDDAERAVRAGLEVVEAVRSLDVPTELSVRVGIATGPVVVGETGGGDPSVPKTAVGETPNLAARVQGMAEPNTVAIGGITRDLIRGAFELNGLGPHSLKGIAEPVEIFRVLEDRRAESSFEATYATHLTPVVGRDSEIALQLDRWRRAIDGEGQVILLNGEPGIGKSRLIHMLREKLAEDGYTPIRYQCSTNHSNSAFHPAIAQLERAAGFVRDDTSDNKLDKLEVLLRQSSTEIDTVAPLFASLLSLPGDRYPAMNVTPQQQKEQTVTALNEQLLGLASQNPVLFLIEDVQWCDPTTLELIGNTITRIVDARVLLIVTHRPEFEAPWTGHAHVSLQTLNRLSKREGAEVIEKVTGGKSLPREVLNLIIAKTDGIPLYVEELTKNVLEAGFLKDAGDRYELDGPLPALAIPATLQESLIARLDRLNTVKTIAQIGACIGREFSHELVAIVSPLSGTELEAALRQLVEAQIILRQGGSTHSGYIFKHALLQDAAYSSLLKENRRQFHDRIADGLLSRFPEVVANTPELLASHLSKAERFTEAVDHWRGAGLRAKSASATQEAVSHFEIALKYLGKEEPSPSRDERELELQAPLGQTMIALHGWQHSKTGAAYERAFKLSQTMDSPPEIFQILYGVSSYRALSDRFLEGLSIAKELSSYAEKAGDKAG